MNKLYSWSLTTVTRNVLKYFTDSGEHDNYIFASSCGKKWSVQNIISLQTSESYVSKHMKKEEGFISIIYLSSTLKPLKICNFEIWNETEKIFSLHEWRWPWLWHCVIHDRKIQNLIIIRRVWMHHFLLYLWRQANTLSLPLSLSLRNICGWNIFRETSSTGRNIASWLQTCIHASHNSRDIILNS